MLDHFSTFSFCCVSLVCGQWDIDKRTKDLTINENDLIKQKLRQKTTAIMTVTQIDKSRSPQKITISWPKRSGCKKKTKNRRKRRGKNVEKQKLKGGQCTSNIVNSSFRRPSWPALKAKNPIQIANLFPYPYSLQIFKLSRDIRK